MVWFGLTLIKPNYFISINYRNLGDTVCIWIKTKGIDMKSSSHDPSIHWKTIHELKKLPETSTKCLDKNFVKIFEPRPPDIEISHRSWIDWKDLEIPKQLWLLIKWFNWRRE
jgi:hypothetical protein